jgi:predicted amidohydrolase
MVKVGVCQMRPDFGKVMQNVQTAVDLITSVDMDIVVLPELFNTGYQFISYEEVMELSEPIPDGPTCDAMIRLSKKEGIYIIFGMAEKTGGRCFNSAVLTGPDGFMGVYRKTHLFLDEKDFFTSGDTGFKVFETPICRIGVMICFDWWFPESARTLALMGADIICHPSNLVLPQCQISMVTRSLENAVYTITANRTGTEKRGNKSALTYTGKSQVVDPQGNVLIQMGEEDVGVEVVEIDIEKARDKSITAKNHRFRDRRPEFYSIITAS